LQHASSAVKQKHKKALAVTSILVQNTSTYPKCQIKTSIDSGSSRKRQFISLIPNSWSMYITAKFGMALWEKQKVYRKLEVFFLKFKIRLASLYLIIQPVVQFYENEYSHLCSMDCVCEPPTWRNHTLQRACIKQTVIV
jgi:hypothetical protein